MSPVRGCFHAVALFRPQLCGALCSAIAAPTIHHRYHHYNINRRTAQVELRRSGVVGTAKSTLRRTLASLLFWLPPAERTAAGGSRSGGVGGGGANPRPPGYGKLPRSIVGHEKTALSQFQVTCCGGGAGLATGGDGGGTGGGVRRGGDTGETTCSNKYGQRRPGVPRRTGPFVFISLRPGYAD